MMCGPARRSVTAVKVLDQLRERIRYLHYSVRTEKTYVYWVRFYIRFDGRRHPAELGGRTRRCIDNDDLHPCVKSRRRWRA